MAQTDTSASPDASTTSVPSTAPVSAPANPAIPDVTLEEFCTRLSASDSRVELIGGFHFTEKAVGRFKDAESNYAARYQAFTTKPV